MARISDFLEAPFKNDEKQEVGIGGFTLLARISESYTKSAEVPTTFLEDGSHVNDHIIRNPLTLNIQGGVSDIHVRAKPVIRQFQRVQAEVGNITQYAPRWTQAQLSRVSGVANDIADAKRFAEAVIDSGNQALDYLGLQDSSAKGNIERFIDAMDSLYESGQLFAIEMPFRRYERMCITSLVVKRNNEQEALEFTLDAQQFRFAEVQFSASPALNPSSFTNGQTDGESDKGVQEGEEVERSLWKYGADVVGGWLD